MSNAAEKQEAIAAIERALGRAGADLLSFSGEVQLWGWAKSGHNTSPWVKIALQDDEQMAPFEAATVRKGKVAGQIYHVFAIRLDEDERAAHHRLPEGGDPTVRSEIDSSSASGTDTIRSDRGTVDRPAPEQSAGGGPCRNELAYQLHRSGWFMDRRLWLAMHDAGIYTMQDHKQAIEMMQCALHGIGECGGDVVAHHCTAADLPVGGARQGDAPNKPWHFFTAPLCHTHHTWLHNRASREDKEQLLSEAIHITAACVKAKIKETIGIDSMTHLTDDRLAGLLHLIGLKEEAWPAPLKHAGS